MVKGWNDPGCRISVRFADSSEQRELRVSSSFFEDTDQGDDPRQRAERLWKSGDQSPSRLTIAQAALLNLRGQELQTNSRRGSVFSYQDQVPPVGRLTHSISHAQDTLPHLSSSQHASATLPTELCYDGRTSPISPVGNVPVGARMDVLLRSISNFHCGERAPSHTTGLTKLNADYRAVSQTLRTLNSETSSNICPSAPSRSRMQTQAQNGFTPAEELILQVHARHLSLQNQMFEQDTRTVPEAHSLLEYQPSMGSDRPPRMSSQIRPLRMVKTTQEFLPTISEDDTHIVAQSWRVTDNCDIRGSLQRYSNNAKFTKPPSRAVSIVPPPSLDENFLKGYKQQQGGAVIVCSDRMRPQPPTGANCQPTAIRASLSESNSYRGRNSADSSHIKFKNQQADPRSQVAVHANISTSPYTVEAQSANELKSPTVISPSLTYSSRTPSTLSPATPFFGSFGSIDTFEVTNTENEDVLGKERKLKGRSK